MSKPVCIVWMNETRVYEQALARAGLGDRVEFHGVRFDQTIPAELAARGEILVGWRPAPGLLAGMPRLRWIQSTTAGMDNWLADPALRADILLTCARGALIVDADLIAAVRAKTIAGAVLDVFRKEPLPADDPFWTTPGITVLPHIGGLHPARDEGVAEVFVANARRFLAGEPLATLVDRARGY